MKDKIVKQHYRIIAFAVTSLLIVIDWTRGSQSGGVWLWTVNMIGPVLMLALAFIWGLKGFIKNGKIYILWTVIGMITVIITKRYVDSHAISMDRNQVISAVIGGWSLGFIYIRLMIEAFIDKSRKLHLSISSVSLYLMLALAFLSVNEDVWPLYFLLCFFPIYQIVPDASNETKAAIQKGVIDAILIMFFVIQGHAFVLRPFDHEHARYCGFYANSNVNALFYTIVYTAFFLRGMELAKKGDQTIVTRILGIGCYLFGASMWGFVFMTGSRTAIITMFGVSAVFLVFGKIRYLEEKALVLTVKSIFFLAIGFVSIFIVFIAVRYIPPLFHHPIWFQGEYSEEKVHSWDPWDSDKYVSYDFFADRMAERYGFDIRKVIDEMPVQALEGNPDDISVDNNPEMTYPIIPTRKDVWKYYLTHGNMIGHSNREGHEIFSWAGIHAWYVWHAQNMFIQFWYYYGVPVALFFALWLGMSGIRALVQTQSDQPQLNIMILCFLTLFVIYGLTEAVWYQGQLIWTLALFLPSLSEKTRS